MNENHQPDLNVIRSTIHQIDDAQGNYQSPPYRPSWLARLVPSVYFYLQFIYHVFHFSFLAQRDKYDDAAWYQSGLEVLHSLEKTGVHVTISGIDNLKKVKGACVLVANHMSTLETATLPAFVQPYKDCTFIIKRGLAEYPVFKHIILARKPIVVDRVDPREDLMLVLKEGKELLQSGRSIVVFPQTTRTLTFDPRHFNTIAIKLARSAGVPIVPIAVRTDAWGNGKLIKEFGKIDPSLPVHFAIGDPIEVEGRGTVAHQSVIAFISRKLSDWGMQIGDTSQPDITNLGNKAATT